MVTAIQSGRNVRVFCFLIQFLFISSASKTKLELREKLLKVTIKIWIVPCLEQVSYFKDELSNNRSMFSSLSNELCLFLGIRKNSLDNWSKIVSKNLLLLLKKLHNFHNHNVILMPWFPSLTKSIYSYCVIRRQYDIKLIVVRIIKFMISGQPYSGPLKSLQPKSLQLLTNWL